MFTEAVFIKVKCSSGCSYKFHECAHHSVVISVLDLLYIGVRHPNINRKEKIQKILLRAAACQPEEMNI